jgi:hypothetical protein
VVDFRKLLSPEKRAELDRRERYHAERVVEAQALSDLALAQLVEYTIQNCSPPGEYEQRGDCTYDAALRHVFIPEMLRRLRN